MDNHGILLRYRRFNSMKYLTDDTDAWIYRLGYNITLTGRIVFIAPPIIE